MNNIASNNIENADSTGEKICLYIEPYAHINIKGGNCLLYNTLDGRMLVYENQPAIVQLLERMTNPRNLNAVVLEKTVLENESLRDFLAAAADIQLIKWYGYAKENADDKKPVSIPPLLNFHRDRGKMKLDPERDPGQDIIKYLCKLDVFINSYHINSHHTNSHHAGNTYDTPLFRDGYKQFPYPYSLPEAHELNVEDIKRLLAQVKDLELCSVSVLGGNIFLYSRLEELVELLSQLPLPKELGAFYKDISAEHMGRINWNSLTNTSIKVFVEPQPENDRLADCIEQLKQTGKPFSFQFVVRSEADADALEPYFDLLEPGQLSVKAFFDGGNFDFFKENIFIEPEDLNDAVISKRDIYARTVMNPNAFGHLTLLSCGTVYSNPNVKPVGTVQTDVKQLLLKELSDGNGWFKTRKNQEPCGGCIFHQVCPPLSNYEYVFARNNLCWKCSEADGEGT